MNAVGLHFTPERHSFTRALRPRWYQVKAYVRPRWSKREWIMAGALLVCVVGTITAVEQVAELLIARQYI